MPESRVEIEEVRRLAEERGALIVAHNYQRPEVQEAAHVVGDSLELARLAASAKERVIVFCGVHFMAESAKILAPEKTVLIPEPDAGCAMADMVTPEDVRAARREHPRAAVVAYINTSADVKAEVDVCCTSANAVAVVDSLGAEEIVFLPDRCLGEWVREHSRPGRRWHMLHGFCPTHLAIAPEDVRAAKEAHPEAEVLAHPECDATVRALADHVLSTGGMVKRAKESPAQEFIVATESGLLYRLRKENPDKRFCSPSPQPLCPTMKMTTLPKLAESLRRMQHEVTVPEDTAARARRSLERMVQIA